MAKNFRAKEYRFLNKECRTTRLIYTPQVRFNGKWCCFPDATTVSKIIEYSEKKSALKKAKKLYKRYHKKGAC